jgi:ribosomal protein L4
MRFPKTTAQKLSYKIAPLNKSPQNEVSKMRTPKICHKTRSQVPSTGRNEVPKTMAQNPRYKIAPLKKSHPSTGGNEVSKGGLNKVSYKIALSP